MREERDLPNDIPDDKKSPDTKTSDSGILRSEIRGRTELATCPSSSKFPSVFGSALERVVETGGRFKRLWLIRHFDYEDSPEADAYRKASERDKSLMEQSEIDSLNEIGKNIRANVDDPQIHRALRAAFRKRPDGTKMVLFSDFNESIMVRNRMTMEWMESDPSTRGSFVSERTKLSVPKMSDGGKKTYDAFTQTKTVIEDWEEGEDDGTMLGNRTFAHPFGLRIGRPCDTEKDATARLERDGYDFWDVEKGEDGKPIIPDGKTLRITPDNAPWLWKILADACANGELKLRISQAFDELPLIMLQEAANDALSKLRTTDRTAFNTALRALCAWKDDKGNPDAELQSYAFERLVELWVPWGELLETEWSSWALEWMATKRHREFVIRYYWESEKGPVENVGPFAKSMNVKGMKSLFDEAYEYWKICTIQRKWSLDKLVQNGDESAFVKRMTCIGESHNESPYISEEDILSFKRHRKYLLRSSVGTGKSIWLSELAKLTLLRGNSVRFYEAKTLKAEMFEPGGEIAKQYAEYPETVFCFDGIDEIPEESEFRIDGIDEIPEESERRKVKRLIAEFHWKCLVISRNDEYEEKAQGFGTLRFVDFDSKTFLNSRITDIGIRKRVFDFLEKEGVGRDLEDNPLLLTLIALLANGNQSFESVRTKSDLYEKAVAFVLASHSKGKKGQSLRAVRLELSDWLKKLSEYAYALSCGKWEGSTNAYFESNLSILHKNGSGGNYEFVHKSFYEYFLATYFANLPEWNERVLDKVSSAFGTGRDWNEFGPVVFFYAEMLERKGDFIKLAEFLKRLPEGDDMYGTGFFLALDVIHKLLGKNGNAPEIENIRDGLVERASFWGLDNILAGFDQICWHWSALGKNRTLFIRALEDKSPELASRLRMQESRLSKSPAIRKATSSQSEDDVALTLDGTSSSWRKLTETLIEDARIDMEKERFVDAGRTYLEIAKRWDVRGFEWAMDAIDAIFETWRNPEYHPGQEIYSQLFGAIIPSAVPVFLRWAEKHMEKKKYLNASIVYSNLVDNGYEEGERGEFLGLKFLVESRKYGDAGRVALSMLRPSDNRFIEPAAFLASALLGSDSKNRTWIRICEKLLGHWRYESSMQVLSIAESLLKGRKNESARLVFGLISRHEKNRLVLEGAFAIAEKYEKSLGIALVWLVAYGPLAATWMPQAALKALASAQEYENGSGEKSHVPSHTIYLQIAQWSVEFRKIAIEWSLKAWEKAMANGDLSFVASVSYSLLEQFPERLDERIVRLWLRGAEHLLDQNRSGMLIYARGIWGKILEFYPNGSVYGLLALVEKLEKKKKDVDALVLCRSLLKTGNPAAFEKNSEMASRFLSTGKEFWVGEIYCELAKNGKTEFMGKAVDLAEKFIRNGEIRMARGLFHELMKISHIDGGSGISRLRKRMFDTASENIKNGKHSAAINIYEAVKSPEKMSF